MASKEPLYEWRGVLLDESRHFLGKEMVLHVLRIMKRLGYNRLHWHLSDDQGFRIASQIHPELGKVSTTRSFTMEGFLSGKQKKVPGPYVGSYSLAELQEIAKVAESQNIEIVPELDMPGHLSALLAAHPEFTCGEEPFEVPTNWGIFDHTLCLGNEKAIAFIKEVVDEMVAIFKPHYFHLGFDEIRKNAMSRCPKCRAKIRQKGLRNVKELIANFRQEMEAYLLAKGIQPIVWDDEIAKPEENAIVQTWTPGSEKKTRHLAKRGQRVIVSPFFRTYASFPYCLVPLKKTYDFNPRKGLPNAPKILGAEVAYWGEYYSSPEKFDFEFCYRAYMLAKTLWGGKESDYLHQRVKLAEEEEELFGKELSIPLSISDPRFLCRLHRLHSYVKKSVDSEFLDYQKERE